MERDLASHPLDPDHVLPSESNPKVPESSAAKTLQAAPDAVRRSMPMALSICLGILLAAVAGWLFYNLTWFLLLLYLSFVAATILEAPVGWLKRHGIRRGFAAVIVMVGGLAVVGGGAYLMGKSIYGQVAAVSTNLERAPQRIDDFVNGVKRRLSPPVKAKPKPAVVPAATGSTPSPATTSAPASQPSGDFDIARSIEKSAPGMDTIWTNARSGVESVSWLVITFFLVLYMLVDGAAHLKALRGLLPKHTRLEATRLFQEVSKAHRGWAFASVTNVCSASILTGTGLYLLGVPGAFVLGFFAGLGELIPNLGPFFGAVPALALTLVADPDKFPYVLGMFLVVQTVQSYGISPQMLKFSIELPVLVTIISVLVFGTLFGFLGILVAIPFVADMVVVWNFVERWREKDTQDYDFSNGAAGEKRRPVGGRRAKFEKLFHRNEMHPQA